MIKALELVTPPSQIMTTAEAKSYLRVDTSTDDTLIDSMIASATYAVENYLNLKLLNQTWNVWLDYFPMRNKDVWWDGSRDGAISELYESLNYIEVPLGPLSSVTHFKTYDNDDTAYTFSSANYYVDTKKGHGRIYVRQGESWPTTDLRNGNGIEIRCVFGYGSSSSSVPAPIMAALRETLGMLYDCRGASERVMPLSAMGMLDAYRFKNI